MAYDLSTFNGNDTGLNVNAQYRRPDKKVYDAGIGYGIPVQQASPVLKRQFGENPQFTPSGYNPAYVTGSDGSYDMSTGLAELTALMADRYRMKNEALARDEADFQKPFMTRTRYKPNDRFTEYHYRGQGLLRR